MKYICLFLAFISLSQAVPIEIVGGDEADIKDFPYMAALIDETYGQLCGAALISNDTVVTAAHCFQFNSSLSQLSVRIGSSAWRSGGQQIFVKEIISHELFDGIDYDVAVVKLLKNVTDEIAVPILLASTDRQYLDGTLGVVTGWGVTASNATSGPEILRKVEVPVYNITQCKEAYGSLISNRTICAGYEEGGKDSCHGDSGGPYVIDGELAGIVSFGIACGLAGYPAVYASVPTFSEWIRRNAGL